MQEPAPITIQEKLIFRNVKRAAIVWILAIRLDPRPITETEAADALSIDKETARKYLRTLHETEILTRLGRFKGYALTEGGRQLTLPIELKRLEPTQTETNAGIPRSENGQSFKSLTTTKDLIDINPLIVVVKALKALIKSERGNSALERGKTANERGNSALGDYIESLEKTIAAHQSTENPEIIKATAEPIGDIIDRILADNPGKQPILDELLNCHIGMNWRTIALLYSDELTVKEIRSQFDFLDKKGKGTQTGILITNLLAKYKPRGADYDPDTGHPLDCNCYKCIGARNQRTLSGWYDLEDGEKYSTWDE